MIEAALNDRITIKASAMIVVPNQERFLMVQQEEDGKWSLPGGGLQANESLIGAAQRELKEEADLNAKLRDLLFVRMYQFIITGQSDQRHGYLFRTKKVTGDPVPKDRAIRQCQYVTKSQARRFLDGDQVYRPEYNAHVLEDLLLSKDSFRFFGDLITVRRIHK